MNCGVIDYVENQDVNELNEWKIMWGGAAGGGRGGSMNGENKLMPDGVAWEVFIKNESG